MKTTLSALLASAVAAKTDTFRFMKFASEFNKSYDTMEEFDYRM